MNTRSLLCGVLMVLVSTILGAVTSTPGSTVKAKTTVDFVFMAVYLFEAESNGKYVSFPVFRYNEEANISFLDKVFDTAEEYIDELSRIYPFESYRLLDVSVFSQCLTTAEGKRESLALIPPSKMQLLNPSAYVAYVTCTSVPANDHVGIGISVEKEDDELIHTAVTTAFGKVVVVGREIPATLSDRHGALFAVLTPYGIRVQKGSQFKDVVDLLLKVRETAPPGGLYIPIEKDAQYEAIKGVFEQVFGLSDFSYAEDLKIPAGFDEANKYREETTGQIQAQVEGETMLPGGEDNTIFVAWDEPPEPVGGYEAIQKNVVYPEFAHKTGVEGRVYVLVVIDEKGNVVKTTIQKSRREDVDRAAVEAIRSVEWKPAKREGKPVKALVGVPVVFRLR